MTREKWKQAFHGVLYAMVALIELFDRDSLRKSANTSLNGKVDNWYSTLLSPFTIDTVLSVVNPATLGKIVEKLDDIINNTELVNGG